VVEDGSPPSDALKLGRLQRKLWEMEMSGIKLWKSQDVDLADATLPLITPTAADESSLTEISEPRCKKRKIRRGKEKSSIGSMELKRPRSKTV
jgi:hypothetical protein